LARFFVCCHLTTTIFTFLGIFTQSELKEIFKDICADVNLLKNIFISMDLCAEVDPVTWKLRQLTSVTSVMGRVTGRIPIESGDNSLLVLEIGGRAIDTQSGLLVGASFVSVPAVRFKEISGNVAEFESALTPWISQALRNFVESN
jgi:hypothetical protein